MIVILCAGAVAVAHGRAAHSDDVIRDRETYFENQSSQTPQSVIPPPEVERQLLAQRMDITTIPTDVGENKWWQRFGDHVLDSLMERAMENNYDVAMAARRVMIARAALTSARSAYYPTLSLGVAWTADRTSGRLGRVAAEATNSSHFAAQAQLSWEVDVFGKVTGSVRAASASVRVSRAERDGVILSLQAQLADAYFNLRVYQAQLAVALSHAEQQAAVVDVAVARYEAGLASMLDVAQAREVYFSTRASIPPLRTSIHTTINSIALLVADESPTIAESLAVSSPIPGYILPIASEPGTVSLRNRPDVVQAERQIDVYAAQLGVARKDYLPTLSLTGSIGLAGHRIDDLPHKSALIYELAPTLSWTAFDGFSRRAAVQTARQNMENAIDNYNLTLMTARFEVDNALTTYRNTLTYIDMLGDVVEQCARAEELSIEKYKRGLAPFINVANAQITYLENQKSVIEAQGQALTAIVSYYKAIGGDF